MNTEKQLTAVEWLVEKIQQANPTFKFDALIREAKAMEKEQIIGAFTTSRDPYGISVGNSHSIKKAEQYYNETFKSE